MKKILFFLVILALICISIIRKDGTKIIMERPVGLGTSSSTSG